MLESVGAFMIAFFDESKAVTENRQNCVNSSCVFLPTEMRENFDDFAVDPNKGGGGLP